MKFYDKIKKEHLFVFIVLLTALILFDYFDFGYTSLTFQDPKLTCAGQGYSCCLQGEGRGNNYFSLDHTCLQGRSCYDYCEASYNTKNLVTGASVFTDAFDTVKNFFKKLFGQAVGGGGPAGPEQECTDGQQQCISERAYRVCEISTWGPTQYCPINTICQQEGNTIVCSPICTNECSPDGVRQCSGNGYRICGNYDSDPCLEWGPVISCAYGCSNGQCTPQTSQTPTVSITHSPPNPTSTQQVTFEAQVTFPPSQYGYYPGYVYIYVDNPNPGTGNYQHVCSINTQTATCSYTGGPYSSGSHTYLAKAIDLNTNLWGTSTTNTFNVGTPGGTFDYSLSNGGSRTVTQGSSTTQTITTTLTSGTTQSVSYSASGLPSGVTASFNPGSCNPTCSTTLTLTASSTASSTAATGTSTITVTGTSGSLTRTTNFQLTVNPQATSQYTLTVNKQGAGTVISSPQGISCGIGCTTTSANYDYNTLVTLTATPLTNYQVQWIGCTVSPSNPNICTVTMSQARTVTATFTSSSGTYTLTVNKQGAGTVISSPQGISCGIGCTTTSANYDYNTLVTLTATPLTNYQVQWIGCTVSPSNPNICTVTMSQARTVTATFTSSSGTYTLTVNKQGAGTVSATGLSCSVNTCVGTYSSGTRVTLTATASSGYNFNRWEPLGICETGPAESTGEVVLNTINTQAVSDAFDNVINFFKSLFGKTAVGGVGRHTFTTCLITMNSNKQVTAVFTVTSCTPGSLQTGTQCLVCNSQGNAYVQDNSRCTNPTPVCNPQGQCVSQTAQSENQYTNGCTDGIDNDGDRAIDELDTDCINVSPLAYVQLQQVTPRSVVDNTLLPRPWEDSEINVKCLISQTGSTLAKAKSCVFAKVENTLCAPINYNNNDANRNFKCNNVGSIRITNVSCNIYPNCRILPSVGRHINYTINITKPSLCRNIIGTDKISISNLELEDDSYDAGDVIRTDATIENIHTASQQIVVSAQLYDINRRTLINSTNQSKTIASGNDADYTINLKIPENTLESKFKMYYKVYKQGAETGSSGICLEDKRSLSITGVSAECEVDDDNDGYCDDVDCNDNNINVHPGATEVCTDNIDNNCNGLIDNLDPACITTTPACVSGTTRVCGVGICQGTQTCVNGQWGTCTGGQQPIQEICNNNQDDDCDSLTDLFDTDCSKADSDNDGLPDYWEMQFFQTLSYKGDEDYDKDGFTNLEEYIAGTSPTDKNSKPERSSIIITILIAIGVIIVALILVWFFALRPKKPKSTYSFGIQKPLSQVSIKRQGFQTTSQKTTPQVNRVLKDYVDSSLKKGYTKEQIKKALLAKGWKNEEIEEAFRK